MLRRPPARCSARLVNGEQRAGGSSRREQERTVERGRQRERERAARRAREAARAAEVEDSPRVVKEKCRQLARVIRNAKHLVVYTGAGISTAADIPDYRGPDGVWTRLRRGETLASVDVARAVPTFTHMALRALHDVGRLRFVVSQNCDGLHLRSGLPRRSLAELHGDMFLERCVRCVRVYVRAFDTTERTARHSHGTRRTCPTCATPLVDTIVHFGERGRAAWPLNWAGALHHAARADVVLCLGSSLKVLRRYPRLWRMSRPPHLRPRLYIVNLQWTPKDAVAALKINARCDTVMQHVARRLRLPVPRYSPRRDPLLAHVTPLSRAELHTSRRVPLCVPPPAPPPAPPPPPPLSSPSASDSEDDRPLLRVAASMSLARRHPHLRLFQVKLRDGEAGILLHAAHAPSVPAPPSPPLHTRWKYNDAPSRPKLDDEHDRLTPNVNVGVFKNDVDVFKINHDVNDIRIKNKVSELRIKSDVNELRIKSDVNELKIKSDVNEFKIRNDVSESRIKNDVSESRIKNDVNESRIKYGMNEFRIKNNVEVIKKSADVLPIKNEIKFNMDVDKVRIESEMEAELMAAASAEAGRIIAGAVEACRGALYPGLHTILRARDVQCVWRARDVQCDWRARDVQCVWCAQWAGARRCLWYERGQRRAAWRERQGVRYECTCCGSGADDSGPDSAGEEPRPGWFGKGYRKGRRTKR